MLKLDMICYTSKKGEKNNIKEKTYKGHEIHH